MYAVRFLLIYSHVLFLIIRFILNINIIVVIIILILIIIILILIATSACSDASCWDSDVRDSHAQDSNSRGLLANRQSPPATGDHHVGHGDGEGEGASDGEGDHEYDHGDRDDGSICDIFPPPGILLRPQPVRRTQQVLSCRPASEKLLKRQETQKKGKILIDFSIF